MAVRIEVDGDVIKAKIDSAGKNMMEMLASQILTDCNRYCKFDTGMLVMSSLIHSNLKKGRLVWQTPYAARQYYEILTANQKGGHPEATSHWCEYAKKLHLADWQRQAQAIKRYYG